MNRDSVQSNAFLFNISKSTELVITGIY